MGKGSRIRLRQVSQEEYDRRYAEAFGVFGRPSLAGQKRVGGKTDIGFCNLLKRLWKDHKEGE
jgi:hypothetical protein